MKMNIILRKWHLLFLLSVLIACADEASSEEVGSPEEMLEDMDVIQQVDVVV